MITVCSTDKGRMDMQIIISHGIGIHTITCNLLTYALFGLNGLLTVIGLLTVLKWIFIGGRKKKPKEPKQSSLERDVKRFDRDMQDLKRYINQK